MFYGAHLHKDNSAEDVEIPGAEILHITSLANESTTEVIVKATAETYFKEHPVAHTIAVLPARTSITIDLVFNILHGLTFSMEGSAPTTENPVTICGYYKSIEEESDDNEECDEEDCEASDCEVGANQFAKVESCSETEAELKAMKAEKPITMTEESDADSDSDNSGSDSGSESAEEDSAGEEPIVKRQKVSTSEVSKEKTPHTTKGSENTNENDDVEKYIESVGAYLKRMGPTPLAVLGAMVPKPPTLKTRLSLLLQNNKDKFKVEQGVANLIN